jgi:hypothetical protein
MKELKSTTLGAHHPQETEFHGHWFTTKFLLPKLTPLKESWRLKRRKVVSISNP